MTEAATFVAADPSRRRFTIRDKSVTIVLSAAVWRLFDTLYGTSPLNQRLTLSRLFDVFTETEPAKFTRTPGAFSTYLVNALALEAAARIPTTPEEPVQSRGPWYVD